MNNVTLIGNLTRDPELRYSGQNAMCRFTLAVNDRRKNPNTGEYEDAPSFIPIVVWGKVAENCEKFLKKGSKCAVVGRIKTGSYTKQDGTKAYTTDVVANNVEFISTTQPAQHKNDGYITRQEYEQEKIPMGFEELKDEVPF